MHIEVQVALNFVISYLYNKLPRRRVNIFGEELEKALKDKFQGHWYPEMPFKGSAFRCLKTGDPIDKVLERAARESGVPIGDILENLPQELAVWVDPGEVSYRIGEKGAVKILFSDKADPQDENSADREVTKTFNPEAQCFRPIESVSCTLSALSLSPKSPFAGAPSANGVAHPPPPQMQTQAPPLPPPGQGPRSPAASPAASYKGSPSPVPPAFIPRSTAPLTFTTATFAQTKFGSTKLKTSSKRANRMSPTEFSNYIKQRAMQQQLASNGTSNGPHHSPGSGRALSPDPATAAFYYHHQYGGPHPHQFPAHHHRSMFESSAAAGQFLAPANGDLYGNKLFGEQAMHGSNGAAANGGYYPGGVAAAINTHQASSNGSGAGSGNQDGGKLLENNWPYTATGQYQHLLVAN